MSRPAYVDDEQNNEIEGSTTEYELKSPDGKEINPDQNLMVNQNLLIIW